MVTDRLSAITRAERARKARRARKAVAARLSAITRIGRARRSRWRRLGVAEDNGDRDGEEVERAGLCVGMQKGFCHIGSSR